MADSEDLHITHYRVHPNFGQLYMTEPIEGGKIFIGTILSEKYNLEGNYHLCLLNRADSSDWRKLKYDTKKNIEYIRKKFKPPQPYDMIEIEDWLEIWYKVEKKYKLVTDRDDYE